jgi:hypothetical protein
MSDQVFTIGSGRSGTKSMSVILSTVFRKSFHEYKQLTGERRKAYLDLKYKGPGLISKINKYKQMGAFHDSDNCNTMFIHHLCRAFPQAKILLPVGSLISFIRAHRVWGIMTLKDKNVNTRAFPPSNPAWKHWPVVVRLAWLWGKRNVEAIKRADKKRLMVFRIHHINDKLPEIFNFIEKPLNDKAIKVASIKHNALNWPEEDVSVAESEIQQHMEQIIKIVRPFKRFLAQFGIN